VRTSCHSYNAAPIDGSISSDVVLQRLAAQPQYAELLAELPNYRAAVDLHLLLHDMVGQQVPLRAAPTKVSDAQGVLLKQAVAGEYTGWPSMVQVRGRQHPRLSLTWLIPAMHTPGPTSMEAVNISCQWLTNHKCWPALNCQLGVVTVPRAACCRRPSKALLPLTGCTTTLPSW
jgi:hypothetical protein